MKNINKTIGVILAFVMIAMLSMPTYASDTNESDLVEITENTAISLAENFATVISDVSLSAQNPIKLYDKTGQAIGYIVDYYYNDIPHGYVIFDNTHDDFISYIWN